MKHCFVGGRDFDREAVDAYLTNLPAGSTVITGDGTGLEKFVREQAKMLGLILYVPSLNPNAFDYFDKHGKRVRNALAMQVTSIFSEAMNGTLILVGNGTRVKATKAILKRAPGLWPVKVMEL